MTDEEVATIDNGQRVELVDHYGNVFFITTGRDLKANYFDLQPLRSKLKTTIENLINSDNKLYGEETV